MRGIRSYGDSRKRRSMEDQLPRELNARPPNKRPRILPQRPSCSFLPICFVRAIGDPSVKYKEPMFDWEMADDSWEYWDFCPPGVDLSMRDKNAASTLEADKRRLDEALERMQRRVDLEQELHRTYPFLAENALVHQWQLHATGWYCTDSFSSVEEQSQESTSVPILGLHPDDHLQSSHWTQPPVLGSEREHLQHRHSENCLPRLGPWLAEMQQNRSLMPIPIAGPSSSPSSFNLEPDAEMYLGSQPRFGLTAYLPSANTHNRSWLDDDLQQPILSSGYCDQKCLELSSAANYVFQQNMPEMQQQQSWSLSRDSMIACDPQEQPLHMESLMMIPTSGGADAEQHKFWYSNERLDSRWQQAPSTSCLAPGIRACSAHSAHPPDPRHGVRQHSGCCDRSLLCSRPGNLLFHSSF